MKLKNNYEINGYKLPKYFIEFLKSKNVLNIYIKNFNIDYGFFRSKKEHYDLINYAFNWESTKEGFDFWYGIHNEWVLVIKKNK